MMFIDENAIVLIYGGYRMVVEEVAYDSNRRRVAIYDLENLRFPLMWSRGLTKTQAEGAMALFNQVGYFQMPQD